MFSKHLIDKQLINNSLTISSTPIKFLEGILITILDRRCNDLFTNLLGGNATRFANSTCY